MQRFVHLDIFIIRAQARQPGSGALRYCTGGKISLPSAGSSRGAAACSCLWSAAGCPSPAFHPAPHPLRRIFFFFSPRLLFVLEKPSHLPFISLSKALDWLRHDDKNWGGFSPLQQLHGQRKKYMHIVTH